MAMGSGAQERDLAPTLRGSVIELTLGYPLRSALDASALSVSILAFDACPLLRAVRNAGARRREIL
jgi:hypothetical protein